MKNTYAQASIKLEIPVRRLRDLVYRREIEHIDEGHRSKFITDAAILRFREKTTRKAIT